MVHFRFQAWCRQATSRIVYVQDRITVERELNHHMEDRYEDMVDQGYSHEEAERLTLEAMGDAKEVAAELAQIYRPFWGLLQLHSRKVLIVALILVAVVGWLNFTELVALGGYASPKYPNFDPYRDCRYIDDAGHFAQRYRTTPYTSVFNENFLITVTNVSLWEYTPNSSPDITETLYVQLRFLTPLPWAQHDGDISDWIWAEDNLGNIYSACNERTEASAPAVISNYCKTSPFTYIHDLYLSGYIADDVQWIKLHYDRAGRDITLHIDLAGGNR